MALDLVDDIVNDEQKLQQLAIPQRFVGYGAPKLAQPITPPLWQDGFLGYNGTGPCQAARAKLRYTYLLI